MKSSDGIFYSRGLGEGKMPVFRYADTNEKIETAKLGRLLGRIGSGMGGTCKLLRDIRLPLAFTES